MQIAISNLAFGSFRDQELIELAKQNNYDLELFYEFGNNYYWDKLLQPLAATNIKLSVHAPCVAVNLADPNDKTWFRIYKDTILFAQSYQAEFVVVHTNEDWQGDKEYVQRLVEERLLQILAFAQSKRVEILIENVGLKTKNNLLYDFEDYCKLLERFSSCGSLIDTGHAHVNAWDLPTVIANLGKRIKALHLHDNNGDGDTHMCIAAGNICWEGCFAAVKQYAPQAKLVLEYSCISAKELSSHIGELRDKYAL